MATPTGIICFMDILNFNAFIDALAPLADIIADRVLQRIKDHEDEKKPRFYTREQVCDILQVSKATLWRLTKQGVLNSCVVGGSVLYDEGELNAAIATGRTRKNARRAKA